MQLKNLMTRIDTIICIFVFILIVPNLAKIPAYKNLKKERIHKQKHTDISAQLDRCSDLFNDFAFKDAHECVLPLVKSSDNLFARHLYARTLFHVGELDKSKAEFEYYIANDKSDNSDYLENAKEYISNINEAKQLLRHDVGDYVVTLENYAVWKNPKDLKVYIYNDYNKRQQLYDAFAMWDSALGSAVDFYFVDNPNNANIVAKAVRRNEINAISSGRIGETRYKIYHYLNYPSKKYMQSSVVKVAINYNEENMLDELAFRSVALHEIGHALGISSHSKSMGDIMYPSTESYSKGKISNRDINTVKKLYGDI